jgi:hypothetical protein
MYFKMLGRGNNRSRMGRTYAGSPLDEGLGITIRFAYPDDAEALARLAALDSNTVPAGPLLVAEVDGELWAAVSVASKASVIADPFRHTAELVALLRERAAALAQIPRRTATRSRQGDALPVAQGGLRRA